MCYLTENVASHFADEKNSCEVSMLSVVQTMFRNEIQSILNPRFRSLNNQRVRFDLYTPSNPYDSQVLQSNDVNSLRKSNFNAKWPTR